MLRRAHFMAALIFQGVYVIFCQVLEYTTHTQQTQELEILK